MWYCVDFVAFVAALEVVSLGEKVTTVDTEGDTYKSCSRKAHDSMSVLSPPPYA